MCTTGFVHVEAMPSVGCGIRDVRGADVMLDNGPVWNNGGPDVNQMEWYCLRARVASCIIYYNVDICVIISWMVKIFNTGGNSCGF